MIGRVHSSVNVCTQSLQGTMMNKLDQSFAPQLPLPAVVGLSDVDCSTTPAMDHPASAHHATDMRSKHAACALI